MKSASKRCYSKEDIILIELDPTMVFCPNCNWAVKLEDTWGHKTSTMMDEVQRVRKVYGSLHEVWKRTNFKTKKPPPVRDHICHVCFSGGRTMYDQ